MTLEEVAELLTEKGYDGVARHKSVNIAKPDELVAVEIFCPSILIDDRMKEVEVLLPKDTFYIHGFKNTDSIYIIQKPSHK